MSAQIPSASVIERLERLGLPESVPPVCIAGMHRSGTSTVAQLLYRLGLYLGREEDLFAPGPSNPEGFWENKHFVHVNEEILETHGGGWDLPPSLEPGWQHHEKLDSQRDRARRLVEEYQANRYWGWKDPRSSLTLPFWLELMPDARIVVCLRNPVEVALSLQKRGMASLPFGLNLWRRYNESLLESMPEGRYIVTHYEAYFHRPQNELRRLLRFLGMPASDQLVAQVRSRVIKGLRNHVYTVEEISQQDPSGRIRGLYLELCAEAEWDPEPVGWPESFRRLGPVGSHAD